jgi:hypothetical protein
MEFYLVQILKLNVMQKFCLLVAFLCLAALPMQAVRNQVVNLSTAGTLVVDADAESLTVTGNINRTDFETMRVALIMANLGDIDLSKATIEACDVEETAGEGNIVHYGSDTVPFQAFNACEYLLSVKLPETALLIESYAFRGCARLEAIDVPESVTDFGVGVFENAGLKTFKFSAGVQYAGPHIFRSCAELTEVDMSEAPGLTAIQDYAFKLCGKLKTVKFPPNLTLLGQESLSETALESLKIPASVTTVRGSLLFGCSQLASVDFTECVNITGANDNAFDGVFSSCPALTAINLSACTGIRRTWFEFQNCTALQSVVLPASLETVGNNTFINCSALSSITILAETPPTLDGEGANNQFAGVDVYNCRLYVPANARTAYESAAVWRDFDIQTIATSLKKTAVNSRIIAQKFYTLTGLYAGSLADLLPDGIYIVVNEYENSQVGVEKIIIK